MILDIDMMDPKGQVRSLDGKEKMSNLYKKETSKAPLKSGYPSE